MNKIFKVVWSKAKQCYVVVSEVAKNHSGKKKIVVASVLAALAVGSEMTVVNVQATIPEGTVSGGAAVAVGPNSKATALHATAVGKEVEAGDAYSQAIGYQAKTTAQNGVAIGSSGVSTRWTIAGANDAVAIGTGAQSLSTNGVAIGRFSKVDESSHSVALGTGSEALAADSANTTSYLTNESVNNSGNGVISVGNKHKATDAGTITRRIVGVASGTEDFDAVNIKQLKALEKETRTRFLAVSGATNKTAADFADEIWTLTPAVPASGTSTGTPATTLTLKGNFNNEAAVGERAVAVGPWANGIGARSVALGGRAVSNGMQAIALGQATFANGENTLALGSYASVHGENSLAIGTDTFVGKVSRGANEKGVSETGDKTTFAVAIGFNAKTYGNASVSLGKQAQADSLHSVVLGESSLSKEGDNTNTTAYLTNDAVNNAGNGVVSIGNADSNVTRRIINVAGGTNDTDAVNVKQLKALETKSVQKFLSINGAANRTKANYPDKTWTIGSPAVTGTDGSVTTPATTSNITLMGNYDNEGARGANSVALGQWANSIGPSSVALGSSAVANGNQAIALGQSTFGHGENTLALGSYATVNGENSIAIGTDSYVGQATRGGAGKGISATGNKTTAAIAIGFGAKAYGNSSTVLGLAAQSDLAHSVVLGEGSKSVEDDGTNGTSYLTGDTVNNSGNGVVSIGNTTGGKNITRRIINVAGGTNDLDAVNVKQLKAVQANEWLLQIKNAGDANATDVTAKTVTGETKKRVVLEAGDNITLENNAGTVKIKANVGVKSITSGNTTALTVSTVDANGAVTITPNVATDLTDTNQTGKLVTAGTVNTALANKVDKTQLGNTPIKYRANGATEATAPTVALSKGFNFTAASDTVATTDVPKAGLAITTGTDGLVTFGLNKATRAAIDNAANKDLSNLSTTGENKVATLAKAAAAVAVKVTSDSTNVTVTKDTTTETGVTNYKVSVAKDVFDNGTNITKAGTGTTADPYKFNLNAVLTGITSLTNGTGAANAAGTTMTVGAEGVTISNVKGADTKTVTIGNAGIDAGSMKITNVAKPTDNGDAANKKYVDDNKTNIAIKTSATAAATDVTSDTVRKVTLEAGDNITLENNAGTVKIKANVGVKSITSGDTTALTVSTVDANGGVTITPNVATDVTDTNQAGKLVTAGTVNTALADKVDKTQLGNTPIKYRANGAEEASAPTVALSKGFNFTAASDTVTDTDVPKAGLAITTGTDGLVTFGLNKATRAAIDNAANKDLSNLSDTGKTAVKDLAKAAATAAIKVTSDSSNVTVTKDTTTETGITNYKVSVAKDAFDNGTNITKAGTGTTTDPYKFNLNAALTGITSITNGTGAANAAGTTMTVGAEGVAISNVKDGATKTVTIGNAGIDAGSMKITNVGTPTDNDDVATKQYVDGKKTDIAIKTSAAATATDVTSDAVRKVTFAAGDNVTLANSNGTITVSANVGVKSITSGDTTALTVSTVDANGGVTITPNVATDVTDTNQAGKLVTAGTVNTALSKKANVSDLGTTPIKYRANGAEEASAPTVALSKGFNFTAASDTAADTDVPKAGLAITTGTDGLVTFGLNKATREAIDNAANKDLSNLSDTGKTAVKDLAKAAAAAAIKVTSNSDNVTVTKDDTTEQGITNYKVSVAKDVFDNGTNITKVGTGTTADPYKFNLNTKLAGITEIAGDGNTDLVIKNGDNKITITPSKPAEGGKEADPGTVDFGDAKVKVKSLDADIAYKAGADTASKTVKLATGFNFTAASDTATDTDVPKAGLAITTGTDGLVTFGLNKATRAAIDNAADKDLSNLSDTGKTAVKDLAKAAATAAIKVTSNSDNVTVTKDDTTEQGITNYKVSVAKDAFDNGTNITKAGTGTTADPYKFNLNAALTGITSLTNGTGAANAAGTTMTVGADGVTISNVKGADTKTVTIGNAGINAGSMKVTNVATPTDNGDAANKKYVDDNKTNIAIKTSATAAATDVTSDTVRKVTLEAGDNITLENSNGNVKIKANVGVKSITSGNTTALTVSTVDANGGVTITPNVATDLTDTNQTGKLVTAGTVNTALSGKVDKTQLGNTPIKYRANGATEATAPTVALSKGFNFTAASDTATDTDVPKAGLAITTGTDGLVTFGLNKATRAAIDNAANKDLSNLSTTGENKVATLAKAAAAAAVKVTSDSTNVTVTKDTTTETGITNYKVSVAKDVFDNGTNITKAGAGTTADPYKFNLNAKLSGITEIAGDGNTDLVIKNGDNKITITPSKAAEAGKEADPGTVDFGNAKVKVKNLDANISYKAGTDNAYKSVSLGTGFTFVAGTGTIAAPPAEGTTAAPSTGTDAETTKSGIAISVADNGVVNIGLNEGTRKAIDNAANKDLSNLSKTGEAKVTELAKTAAQSAVKVVAGKNVTVDTNDKTQGVTTYTVNANDTTITAGSDAVTVSGGTLDETTKVRAYTVDLSDTAKTAIGKVAGLETRLSTVESKVGVNEKAIADNKQGIADNKQGIADNKKAIANNTSVITQVTKDIQNLKGNSATKDLDNLSDTGKANITKLVSVVGENGIVVTEAPNKTTGGKTFTVKMGDTTKVGSVEIKDGKVSGLTNTTWNPTEVATAEVAQKEPTSAAAKNRGVAATQGQVKDLSDTISKGRVYETDTQGKKATVGLGDTLAIKGGATGELLDSNIGVELTEATATTPATMTVKLAKDVKMGKGSTSYDHYMDVDGKSTLVATTKVDGTGVTITPAKGIDKPVVQLTADGLNNGGNRITNVGAGKDAGDVATVGQVNDVISQTTAKIGRVLERTSQRIDQVGAHASALSAMNPLGFDPAHKSQIMAGIGSYGSNQALALGLAHYANENFMFNVGFTMGEGKSMANVGATYRFGTGDDTIPERYKGGPISSVYVMQDEITALKAENARKDAEYGNKIDMLMERIAMLEAKLK